MYKSGWAAAAQEALVGAAPELAGFSARRLEKMWARAKGHLPDLASALDRVSPRAAATALGGLPTPAELRRRDRMYVCCLRDGQWVFLAGGDEAADRFAAWAAEGVTGVIQVTPVPVAEGAAAVSASVWDLIWPWAGRYGWALGLSVLLTFIGVLPAIFASNIYQRVLPIGNLSTLAVLLGVFASAVLIDVVTRRARLKVLESVGSDRDRWLRATWLRDVFRISVDAGKSGLSTLARQGRLLETGLSGVSEGLSAGVVAAVVDVPLVVVLLGVLALLHPWLAIAATFNILVLVGIAAGVKSRQLEAGRVVAGLQGERDRWFSEILRARRYAGVMGWTALLSTRDKAASGRLSDAQETWRHTGENANNLAQSWSMLAGLLMLSISAYLVVKGELGAGGVIAASLLGTRATQAVSLLIGAWPKLLQIKSAMALIGRLAGLPQEEAAAEPAPVTSIGLTGVDFTYAGRTRASLKDVTVDFERGKITALAGFNGCGKTTLLGILAGMDAPQAGALVLNGSEAGDTPPLAVFLPQEPVLISQTVAEMLDGALPWADQLKVCFGARGEMLAAQLSPTQTIDPITWGGVSRGQLQMLCLTRLVAQAENNPGAMLLLDEPTNHLDSKAIEPFLARLKLLAAEGRVVVVASHNADLLSSLPDGGVILMQPTPDRTATKRVPRQAFLADPAPKAS